jgi:hypothetical protein
MEHAGHTETHASNQHVFVFIGHVLETCGPPNTHKLAGELFYVVSFLNWPIVSLCFQRFELLPSHGQWADQKNRHPSTAPSRNTRALRELPLYHLLKPSVPIFF